MSKAEIIMKLIGETRYFIKNFRVILGYITGVCFHEDEIKCLDIDAIGETHSVLLKDTFEGENSALTRLAINIDNEIRRLQLAKREVDVILNKDDIKNHYDFGVYKKSNFIQPFGKFPAIIKKNRQNP